MMITQEMQDGVVTMLETMHDSEVRIIKMASGIVMIYGASIDQLIDDLNSNTHISGDPEGLEVLSEHDVLCAIEEAYIQQGYWLDIPEDEQNQIIQMAKGIYDAIGQYYLNMHMGS